MFQRSHVFPAFDSKFVHRPDSASMNAPFLFWLWAVWFFDLAIALGQSQYADFTVVGGQTHLFF